MASLTQAVYDLVKLYLRSFCPPSASFRSPPLPQAADGEAVEGRSSKEASGTTDHLQFTLFALHGIPTSWVSRSVSGDELRALLLIIIIIINHNDSLIIIISSFVA